VIINPLQLAVMGGRIASGRDFQPRLIGVGKEPAPLLGISPEHLEVVRGGMWEVVNGDGTAGASKLQVPGIEMSGKTGTAQVRRLSASASRGQGGDWKYRDHVLFVCFAPSANPRYACSVVIEHGLGGARAAAPVAKDVLTFLFDRPRALESLAAFEQQWGGTLAERTARRAAAIKAASEVRRASA
jgi:penicillin-binding protein 2